MRAIQNEIQSLGFAFKKINEHMNFSPEQLRLMGYSESGNKITSKPVEREADLHAQIIAECRRLGWIVFHGSMAHKTFRTEGEPDFAILGYQGRVFLIECKTAKGKLSPSQNAMAAWAARLGHKIHVVRSVKEFLEITKG